MADKGFFDYVQEHEREWGNATYPGRPSLQSIMTSPVVVFWGDEKYPDKAIITLHTSVPELENVLGKLVTRSLIQPIDRYVQMLFSNQQPLRISGVKIQLSAQS